MTPEQQARNSTFTEQEFEESENLLKDELNELIQKWKDKGHFVVVKLNEPAPGFGTSVVEEVIFKNKHFKFYDKPISKTQ